MDPVTHIVAGGLQGTAIRPLVSWRRIVLFCVLASWLPDIDNLVGFVSPELYLVHHRGITHSFIGGLALALILTLIFRLFDRSVPLVIGVLVAYAGIVNHIFLDLITSYGTQILAPFSRQRFSVQCVFIIDPLFTVSLGLLWWLSRKYPDRRTRFAVIGLVWLVAYPLINLGVRTAVEEHLEHRLTSRGIPFSKLEVSTEAFSPFNWKVILETPTEYKMAPFSLLHGDVPLKFTTYRKADHGLMERLGRRVPLFRTYAWFAMYPVMRVRDIKDGRLITFSDLRFISTLSFIRNHTKNRDGPFALTARVDRAGNLVAYAYQRPRRAKIMQHLE